MPIHYYYYCRLLNITLYDSYFRKYNKSLKSLISYIKYIIKKLVKRNFILYLK